MSTILTSIAVALGFLIFATAPGLADAAPVQAAQRPVVGPTSEHGAKSKRDSGTVVGVDPSGDRPLLQIENLRLDSPSPTLPRPAALLKFDVLNETSLPLTDVVLRVSLLEEQPPSAEGVPARVLVGPITVHMKAVLQAESVLSYEILFRNFSSDCGCSPSVEVLSVRLQPE
jgi:hypothetical protein